MDHNYRPNSSIYPPHPPQPSYPPHHNHQQGHGPGQGMNMGMNMGMGPGQRPPPQQPFAGGGGGGGPGYFPPQHQHQNQHQNQHHSPRPNYGMPLPQQPNPAHQGRPQSPSPYPPSFNHQQPGHGGHGGPGGPIGSGMGGPGFGGPGGPGGPGFGGPGGPGGPGFGGPGGSRPGLYPGNPPPHSAPSLHANNRPMMMPQVAPQGPPRHQEWPPSGRPPANYPPTTNAGNQIGFTPKPYPSSTVAQPSPSFHQQQGPYPGASGSGQSMGPGPSGSGLGPGGPVRPSYSPNIPSAMPTPILATPSTPGTPYQSFRPATPLSTPLAAPPVMPPMPSMPSMPQVPSYRPKTTYQAPAVPSPKTAGRPSPTVSLLSVSSVNTSGYNNGYHDADDRPTELIPVNEEHYPTSLSPPSQLPAPPAKNTSWLQSPPPTTSKPASGNVSPSLSFNNSVQYLPASPSISDTDSRPTEMPQQQPIYEQVKPVESIRKPDPLPSTPLPSLQPTTPLPTPGSMFAAPTFKPSTTYVSTKKETAKPPTSSLQTPSKVFDPTVKVEVSDYKPISNPGAKYGDITYKVDVSDLPASSSSSTASRPQPPKDNPAESPISVEDLMASIDAMTMTNTPGQSDYFKPLPQISEGQPKRYSLSDGPVQSPPSSRPPAVSGLVPKRPTSGMPMVEPPRKDSSFNSSPTPSTPQPLPHQPLHPPQPLSHHQGPPPSQGSHLPPPPFQRLDQSPKLTFQQSPPPPPHSHSHPGQGQGHGQGQVHGQGLGQNSHNHNHAHFGANAMMLLDRPEFSQNPVASMATLAVDRPVIKGPSMIQRGKTLKRAAGMTGHAQAPMNVAPAMMPMKVTPDDLYPYLLRLVLLAQADEVPAPAPALPPIPKDAHKDLIKALRSRVKDILAGKDLTPAYQDPVVKKALSNMEPKQFKASTNAEELLMSFSIEMSRIQQSMNIAANDRHAQIAIMVNLLREVIQRDPFVGHEAILARLDAQVKKTTVKPNNSAQADELTKVIKELFKPQESMRFKLMNDLRRSSTKQVAIEDLKKCASNLERDAFPYPTKDDYHHREHHEEFKNRERSALNGFIRILSANLSLVEFPSNHFQPSDFTFIPQNPKAFYHLLLEMCVDHALAFRAPNDPVSNLLSASTRALLIDCGVRWRLTSSWREIILMEVIKDRYREGRIPIDFLLDFLHTKPYKDADVPQWHISEVNMLGNFYGALNHMIMDNINHDIKDLESLNADYFGLMLAVLDRVHEQEVYQRLNIDLKPFFEDIKETVLLSAIRNYNAKDEEVQKEPYENETVPLTKMALYIVSEHGIMKKRFPKPLLGTVDVAAIVVENHLRNFVPLMQNMANMDAQKLPMTDVFPLYQLCRQLVTLFETYAPSFSEHFNISTWFRPYVLKYLEQLDMNITTWVTRAINQDKWEEVSVGAGHSSSASDLFTFFYEPLSWIQGLHWPNDYQRATFMSRIAKVFCKAVDLYADTMESMFVSQLPSSVNAVASTEAKSLAEQITSFAFRSEAATASKASQFMLFTPKMCILMNNIEEVRKRLDELYRNMEVDQVIEILREHEPEPVEDPNATHEFEIVFVSAERLLPVDSNEASDPYIVLKQGETEIFRSKTIYANLNPRWNEAYKVTLSSAITYLICVMDSDKVHKDRFVGWQQLDIDPEDYLDYMPHDIWLDLCQVGRLLLRVTMKGERDDVQFFFGRTFRSLKRKEADLSGMIVDAMVPSVQACLTEKVLFSNFRSKATFPFFGSSVSSAKVTKVSDEECDNALGPLLDYLEAALPVLYDYLKPEGRTMVITKLWKEMLITIESLLMPPLAMDVSSRNSLDEIEMHVVFKIVEFIKLYLNGGDAGDGFPLKVLEIPKYKDLLTVRPIYDATPEELIEEYRRALTVPGRGRLARQQSDFDRRAAGVPRRPAADSMTPNPETVLRILRMRKEENINTFLETAIDTQSKAREARAKSKREQQAYQRQMQHL